MQKEQNQRHEIEKIKSKVPDINQTISVITLNMSGLKTLIKDRDCQTG